MAVWCLVAGLLVGGCNAVSCSREKADVAAFLTALGEVSLTNSGAAFETARRRLGYAEDPGACPANQRCAFRSDANVMFGPGTHMGLSVRRAGAAERYTLTLQSFHSACGVRPTTMDDEALTPSLGSPDRIVRRSRLLTELGKRYWRHRGGIVATEAPGWLRRWVSFQSPAMVGDPNAYVLPAAPAGLPSLREVLGRLDKNAPPVAVWRQAALLPGTRQHALDLSWNGPGRAHVRLVAGNLYRALPRGGWNKAPGLVGFEVELTALTAPLERRDLASVLAGLGVGRAGRLASAFLRHLRRSDFPDRAWRSAVDGDLVLLMRAAHGPRTAYRLGVWRRLEFWPGLRPPPV